eukprot:SAG31_NODE_2749_length_5147_cov_1.972662_9_plen_143_part_00
MTGRLIEKPQKMPPALASPTSCASGTHTTATRGQTTASDARKCSTITCCVGMASTKTGLAARGRPHARCARRFWTKWLTCSGCGPSPATTALLYSLRSTLSDPDLRQLWSDSMMWKLNRANVVAAAPVPAARRPAVQRNDPR